MKKIKKYLFLFSLISFFLFKNTISFAQNDEILKVLELIQKDLKTLERAVYSENFSSNEESNENVSNMDQNSEEVLTRHLLKLSEIEKQFQELTNRYEEINYKLDKLSTRLSKVQADNQLRFQQIENNSLTTSKDNSNLTSVPKSELSENKVLPGSSQPQDLGSISYKDMTDNSDKQIINSVEIDSLIVSFFIFSIAILDLFLRFCDSRLAFPRSRLRFLQFYRCFIAVLYSFGAGSRIIRIAIVNPNTICFV